MFEDDVVQTALGGSEFHQHVGGFELPGHLPVGAGHIVHERMDVVPVGSGRSVTTRYRRGFRYRSLARIDA